MHTRAQALLETAARETSNQNEALNAIRMLHRHIEKHGWPSSSSPHPATHIPLTTLRKTVIALQEEVADLGDENADLRDQVERLTVELARAVGPPLSLEERVREAVATSRTKTEAVTKLGWSVNTYSFRRLSAYGFDQSHFVGRSWRLGQKARKET